MPLKSSPKGVGPPLKEVLDHIDRFIAESDYNKGADLLDVNRAAFEANRGTSIYVEYLVQDARLYVKRHRLGEAGPMLEKAEAAMERLDRPESEKARLRQFRMLASAEVVRAGGDELGALSVLDRAIASREERDATTGLVQLERARIMAVAGRGPDAVETMKKAIAIFEECSDSFGLARSYSNLSDVYGKLEDWGKALEAAKTGIDIAKANGHKRSEGFSSLNCAEALMRLGHLDKAKAFIMEAQDAFMKSEDHYFLAALNYMLGVLQNKEGAFELASESLETSMDNLEESDPRYLFALVHQEWATSLKALGDIEGAREHLEEAAAAWDGVPNPKAAQKVRDTLGSLNAAKGE